MNNMKKIARRIEKELLKTTMNYKEKTTRKRCSRKREEVLLKGTSKGA
jgi:hypothetical protein